LADLEKAGVLIRQQGYDLKNLTGATWEAANTQEQQAKIIREANEATRENILLQQDQAGAAEEGSRSIEKWTKEQLEGTEAMGGFTEALKRQISTIVTDLSRGLAEALVYWKGFWQTMKDIAEQFIVAILRLVIESFLAKIVAKLAELLGLVNKVAGSAGGGGGTPWWKKVLGGIGTVLGGGGIGGGGSPGATGKPPEYIFGWSDPAFPYMPPISGGGLPPNLEPFDMRAHTKMVMDMGQAYGVASGYMVYWGDAVTDAAEDSQDLLEALDELRMRPIEVTNALYDLVADIRTLENAGASSEEILAILGQSIFTLAEAAKEVGVPLPDVIQDLIDFAQAAQHGGDAALYLAESTSIATQELNRFEKANAAGVQSAQDMIAGAEELAQTVLGFGKEMLMARGLYVHIPGLVGPYFVSGKEAEILQVQIGVFRQYQNQIIATARAYDQFGLAIPPSLQQITDFGIEHGLVTQQQLLFNQAVEETTDVITRGLDPIREFATSLGDVRQEYERILTPLERFAELERQLMQEQELTRLAQYALVPAFTTGQAVSSIVQQALGLGPGLAGELVTSALSQFGAETTFGAVELLRRREFATLAEALGATQALRQGGLGPSGAGGQLTLNLNLSTPDPDAGHDFLLTTWLPALVAILQNRQDAGQIVDAIKEQFND
jgi:hypothetical protein